MQNFVLIIHVITAVSIIAFILVQQGKGAEAGASFGAGASQTIFGSVGSWNFFSKVTAILAAVFFATSVSLAVIAKKNTAVPQKALPAIEQYQAEQQNNQADEELPGIESDVPENDIPESNTEIPSAPGSGGSSEIPEL